MSSAHLRLPLPFRSVRIIGASAAPAQPPCPPVADSAPASISTQSPSETLLPVSSQTVPLAEDISFLLTAMDEVCATLQEAESRRQAMREELQVVAIELAIAAAAHVIGRELESSGIILEPLIDDACARLGLGRDAGLALSLVLNPGDLQQLQTRLGDQLTTRWPAAISLQADAQLPRGSFRVERNDGTGLLSDVPARLEQIRQCWLEGLEHAQTERRDAARSTQSLRRFPDRRQTAERTG